VKAGLPTATYFLEETGPGGWREYPLGDILNRLDWLTRINKTYCGEMEVPLDIAAQMLGQNIESLESKLYFLSVRVNYDPSSTLKNN
jgi:hypothetical protein